MFERAKRDYKPKKQRIHFSLPEEVLREFEQYCEDNGYKRNELIECILEDFLKRWGTPKKEL